MFHYIEESVLGNLDPVLVVLGPVSAHSGFSEISTHVPSRFVIAKLILHRLWILAIKALFTAQGLTLVSKATYSDPID